MYDIAFIYLFYHEKERKKERKKEKRKISDNALKPADINSIIIIASHKPLNHSTEMSQIWLMVIISLFY